MRSKRQWSFREIERLLKENGFCKSGGSGSHVLFTNDVKSKSISIPMSLNCMLIRRVLKENDIALA